MNRSLLLLNIVVSALICTGGAAHAAAPSNQVCESRVNDSEEKLLECIDSQSLWQRLAIFQKISDANPGIDGHGNRDTGTNGYWESVKYVGNLMKKAGYQVSVQPYRYKFSKVVGTPHFFALGHSLDAGSEWALARLSGGGLLSAGLQPASISDNGCTEMGFQGFTTGNVALLQRAGCARDTQVANATRAGALAVIFYENAGTAGAYPARLTRPASIPVISVSSRVGSSLLRAYSAGNTPWVHFDIRTQTKSGTDYNLIAESPYGDPNHIVVIEGHLDAIYGAGMLDNASGSTTIMEIALKMAHTPTRNRMRYIWFGGEELGLLGSTYYTQHLSSTEVKQIAFDIDADVTATPNYDYLIADPAFASNVNQFPKSVVPESRLGNDLFKEYFLQRGVPVSPAWFGNDGTDSNSFSLVGVPDSGILTQQDCCKTQKEVDVWGGFLGNYEGKLHSFNGGCVDYPARWCDNLDNNDPKVLDLASKATAYVTFKLANHGF